MNCPNCSIELMEHEAGKCLNRWITDQLGWAYEDSEWIPSTSYNDALWLMERIWEIDDTAAIHKEYIGVDWCWGSYGKQITGETLALRICRAFLWLKEKR